MNRTLRNLVRLCMALAVLLGLVASAQADVSVQVNGATVSLPSPTGDKSTWVGAWGRLSHFNNGDDRVFVQIANYSNADFQWAYSASEGTDSTKLVISAPTGSTISAGFPCSVDSDCKRSYEVCGGPILGCTDISNWQVYPYSCATDTDCPANFGCVSSALPSGVSTTACMCKNNAACGPNRFCGGGSCIGTDTQSVVLRCGSGCPSGSTCWQGGILSDYDSACLGPSCSTDSDCNPWSVLPKCTQDANTGVKLCGCSVDTDCQGMGFQTPKCGDQPGSGPTTTNYCYEGGSAPTIPVYSPWGNQWWSFPMPATKANAPPSAMGAIFSFDHTDSYYNPSIHIGFTPVFHNADGTTTQGKPLELQIWVQGAPSALLNDIKMAYEILKLTVSAIVAPEMDVEEALKFIKDSLDEADKIVDAAGSIDMSQGEDANHFNAGIVAPGDGLDSTSQFPTYSQKTSSPTNRIDVIVYHPNYPEGSAGAHAHAQYIQIYTVMDDCDQVYANGVAETVTDTGYCDAKLNGCFQAANVSGYYLTYNSSNCSKAFYDENHGNAQIVNKLVMNIHSYAQFASYFSEY